MKIHTSSQYEGKIGFTGLEISEKKIYGGECDSCKF